MSEPVLRRTQSGRAVATAQTAVLRSRFSLASVLSLCGVISLLSLNALPVQAQAAVDPQTRYSIESKRAVSHLLLDITQAGDRLVAAGDRGHILFSDDAGKHWLQAKVPTRQLLTALHFVDDKHGWAVGHDALVLATQDGGENWNVQYEEREREAPLLDVWFENPQYGIAVGAYGALIETTDGGQSWNDISDRLDNEDGVHLNAIAQIQDGGLLVVGEMGSLFRSSDLGQSWERLDSPYEGSFFGVLAGGESGLVFAYGLRGHLFRSVDSGDSWEQIELSNGNGHPLESGLAGGSVLRDGRIIIVGHGGAVLTSSDQGRTFKYFSRPDRLSLSGVSANGGDNLVLVGQGGARITSPSGADLATQQ